MLDSNRFMRKTLKKKFEKLDGEMQSRYDRSHGENGLCAALSEIFNSMAEIRMKAEYGDNSAYACSALKGTNMNDMIWKIQKLNWQQVEEKIKEEERTLADELARRVIPSPTPFLDDVKKAAERLGYEESLVRYQILSYPERNNFCHSGIPAMIQRGDFQKLAERIMEDKRSLQVIFRYHPDQQMSMRSLIKLVEKEWFVRIWVDETRHDRPIKFVLSKKDQETLLSTAPPGES